jgi:hypothetical protein
MKLMSLAAAIALTAAVAIIAPAGADVVPQTYAPRDCTTPKQEPKSITLSCGDAGAVLKHLKWQNWSDPKVKGAGDLYLKDCNPDCVSGGTDRYRVKVTLKGLKTTQCAGQTIDMYTKAKLKYLGDAPPHASNLRKFPVDCVS